MKRLDVGGVQAPQLLFLEPNSTLIFSNINVSGALAGAIMCATMLAGACVPTVVTDTHSYCECARQIA